MKATRERLDELVRMPRNPKAHDLGALHQSYGRFGFLDRVVINEVTGHLLAGHGRVDALQQRKVRGYEPPVNISEAKDGMWLVPADWVSVPEELEEAALLALNRVGEGEWDEPDLVEVLSDLAATEGLEGTGFDADDLDDMLARLSALSLEEGGGEGLGAVVESDLPRLVSVEVSEEVYARWEEWVSKVAPGRHGIAFEEALRCASLWYDSEMED